MSDIVTLTHRNVCKNGFTVSDTADSGTPSSTISPNCAQMIYPQSSWTCLLLGRQSSMQKLPLGFVPLRDVSDDTTRSVLCF